jgi:hypothetical protein
MNQERASSRVGVPSDMQFIQLKGPSRVWGARQSHGHEAEGAMAKALALGSCQNGISKSRERRIGRQSPTFKDRNLDEILRHLGR